MKKFLFMKVIIIIKVTVSVKESLKLTTIINEMTGMTKEQIEIVLECQNRRQGAPSRVQLEFSRTAARSIEANRSVVEKPSVS